MEFIGVISQIIILFLVVCVGYLCGKLNYIDDHVYGKLSKILLNITLPCMIVASAVGSSSEYDSSTIVTVWIMAIAMFFVLIPVIGIIINFILKTPEKEKTLFSFMTICSNLGFMGYPVIKAIYGQGSIFLCSFYIMIFSVALYTIGIFMLAKGKGEKSKFNLKQIITPGMIACIISLILFLTKIQFPEVIKGTLDSVGGITSPLAMMLIGVSMTKLSLKGLLKNGRLYLYTLLKQLVFPLICYFVMSPFISNKIILGIFVVMLAMPTGPVAVMFANQYKKDSTVAAETVLIGTISSFIAIPLLCMVLI